MIQIQKININDVREKNCTGFINRRLGNWQLARTIKINARQGKCERCGGVGEEVHHQIRLTLSNLNDSSISLDQKNLELLCKVCHNEEHGRFKKKEVLFDENGDFLG